MCVGLFCNGMRVGVSVCKAIGHRQCMCAVGLQCEARGQRQCTVCGSLPVQFGKFFVQGKLRLPALRVRVTGSGRCEDGLAKAERRCACGELELGGSDERSEPQLVHRVCALRHRVQGLPVVNVEEGDEDEELIPDPAEPAGVTEDEGELQEDLHVPLDDQVYIEHVARGHQPYLPSCSLCVSSRGVIPARRRCDPRLTVDHLRCLFLAVPLPAAAVQGCGVVGAL